MGSRRLRPMTAADLRSLPEPCARCTFWEASLTDLAAPVRPSRPARDQGRVGAMR